MKRTMNQPIIPVLSSLLKDSCQSAITGSNRIIMPILMLSLFMIIASTLFCNCTPAEPDAPEANKNSGISISVDSMRNVYEDIYVN